MKRKNNLFNINNLYIAINSKTNKIVGILCAIDKSLAFDHDYEKDKMISPTYDFTITNYVEPLEREIEESDNNQLLYISNICVSTRLRGRQIGSKLLGCFISLMEQNGYNTFALDCLLHNLRAKNLYHGFGFKEMKEIVGFDGTDASTVEVVSFLRKKGTYYPSEFMASALDDNLFD